MWSKNNHYFKYFLKKYLFINNYLVPFKVTPPRSFNTLMLAFFPILETFLKRAFWYRQQLLFRFFFYLLNRNRERFPFISVCSFGKRKKSSGPRPVNAVLETRLQFCFWAKTQAQTSMCGLQEFKIHDWFFHNSVHFWGISSRNRCITSRLYSLLTVRPWGTNSWCPMPL